MNHQHEPMSDDPNTCRHCGLTYQPVKAQMEPERMTPKEAAKWADRVLLARGYVTMREM